MRPAWAASLVYRGKRSARGKRNLISALRYSGRLDSYGSITDVGKKTCLREVTKKPAVMGFRLLEPGGKRYR